jgi:hypothetical protein
LDAKCPSQGVTIASEFTALPAEARRPLFGSSILAPFRHSSTLASLPVATLKNDMFAATTEISCRLDNGHQGAGGAVTMDNVT